MPNPKFIPAKVGREQFIEAMRPLLDLLGVTAMNILDEIHVQNGQISFLLVPQHGLVSPEGQDVSEGDAREFAAYAIPVAVEVVG